MSSSTESGFGVDSADALKSVLEKIIRSGGFNLTFAIHNCEPGEREEAGTVVEFDGPDADLLVEKNGALLDAIEHVALKAARVEEGDLRKFSFDCRGWRLVRADELRLTARIAADRVIELGQPFELSPMNSRERRIIHLALKDEPAVRTLSDGFGASRKVVILPAKPL